MTGMSLLNKKAAGQSGGTGRPQCSGCSAVPWGHGRLGTYCYNRLEGGKYFGSAFYEHHTMIHLNDHQTEYTKYQQSGGRGANTQCRQQGAQQQAAERIRLLQPVGI
jgi:hypothetical protein